MISVIFKTYFHSLLIIAWLSFFLIRNNILSKKVARIFYLFLAVLTALICADAFELYLSMKGNCSLVRYMIMAFGYTARVFMIELMTMLVRRHSSWLKIAGFFPLALFMIVAFTTKYTHWLFYFDESGAFCRGVLGWLPFGVCALYFSRLELTAFQDYKNDTSESVLILIIALSCIIASGVDMLSGFAYYLDISITVSIVFYYIFQLIQVYRRDPLTDILNRRSFYQDIKQLSKGQMIIISVDMNNLKKINDEHGHAAGDTALLTVTDSMLKTFKPKGRVYRIGGDEFVVLCPMCDIDSVQGFLKTLNNYLMKTPYSVACGFSEYKPDMIFSDVLADADKKMYQNKSAMKASMDRIHSENISGMYKI